MPFNLAIPTYILIISFTYTLCILWVYSRAKKLHLSKSQLNGDKGFKSNPDQDVESRNIQLALDLCLVVMISGLIGSRGMHVIYEDFEYYRQNPLDIFKLWQGGFVFYGGMIFALISSFVFLKIKKEPFLRWADVFALPAALGYAFGRIGCLMSGCCFGKLCEWPWAIEFHADGLPLGPRHPTQLYASIWEIAILSTLILMEKRKPGMPTGRIFFTWVALHALGRFFLEFFRDDFRGPSFLNLSISALISLVLLFFGIAGLFIIKKPKSI